MHREFVRRGDFVVPEDELEDAKEAFSKRSKRSRALDKSLRAPVTDDYDRWVTFQSGLDYPGVDTPTDSPPQDLLDFPLPDERSRMAHGRERGVKLSDEPMQKSFGDVVDESLGQLESLKGVLDPSKVLEP